MNRDGLLVTLQRGVPIEPRPFEAIAHGVEGNEEEVIAVAQSMLDDGSARRFGAIFDARRLGYHSELCAIDVCGDELETVAGCVSRHPGVTHCYERGTPPDPAAPVDECGDNKLPRLWFTLAVRRGSFERDLSVMEKAVSPYPILRFRALRRFKIDVVFDPGERELGESVPPPPSEIPGPGVPLTEPEQNLVRVLQGSVTVCADLYGCVAEKAGWTKADVIDTLRRWKEVGILRRIALVVRHRRIGFIANAMCLWPADPETVADAGRLVAEWPAVTHCYERECRPGWRYNVFAMIHTNEWRATRELFERISESAGLSGGVMLGSLREFKKTSMRYFE